MKYQVSMYDENGEGLIHEGVEEMLAVQKAWEVIRTDVGPLSVIPQTFDQLLSAIVDAGLGDSIRCEMLVTKG